MKKLFALFLSIIFISSLPADETAQMQVGSTSASPMWILKSSASAYGYIRSFDGNEYIALFDQVSGKWKRLIGMPQESQNMFYWNFAKGTDGEIIPDASIYVYQGTQNINILWINFSSKTGELIETISYPSLAENAEDGEIIPNFTQLNGKLVISGNNYAEPNSMSYTNDLKPFITIAETK